MRTMQPVVRIGRLQDQDQIRREDCRRMTGDERVAALLAMRNRFAAGTPCRLERCAKVVRLRGIPHA